MSLFFVIIALLGAAIICVAEGTESIITIILVIAAVIIALLSESGTLAWPARRQ